MTQSKSTTKTNSGAAKSAAPTMIDAVITWVDGGDPQHQAKLNEHLMALGKRPKSADPTRFRSVGEIDYCVASIVQYAPYIRHIYIITDQQRPPLVDQYMGTDWADRIRVIDHRDIFTDHADALPTFNSLSIETVMYRIPGLAEHFIYLNDDFSLIRATTPETFFIDGIPILRGRFRRQSQHRVSKKIVAAWRNLVGTDAAKIEPSFKRALELSAQLTGEQEHYWCISHTPHPMRKSLLEDFFAKNPAVLETNLSYKLRDVAQFSTVSLANHLEFQQGTPVTSRQTQVLNLKPTRFSPDKLAQQLEAAEHNSEVLFACFQSLDNADSTRQNMVLKWLDNMIKRPERLVA